MTAAAALAIFSKFARSAKSEQVSSAFVMVDSDVAAAAAVAEADVEDNLLLS